MFFAFALAPVHSNSVNGNSIHPLAKIVIFHFFLCVILIHPQIQIAAPSKYTQNPTTSYRNSQSYYSLTRIIAVASKMVSLFPSCFLWVYLLPVCQAHLFLARLPSFLSLEHAKQAPTISLFPSLSWNVFPQIYTYFFLFLHSVSSQRTSSLRKAFPDYSAETAPSYSFPLSKLFGFTFLKSTYHHLTFHIFVCLLSVYFIIIWSPTRNSWGI